MSSKVQSCSTSEYMMRSSKLESFKPVNTALAIEPIPACNGPRFLGKRPSATSFQRKQSGDLRCLESHHLEE